MKKIFIHIGYPKTATTTVQAICAANGDILREHGLLYPEAGRLGINHPLFSSTVMEPDFAGWIPPADESIWPRFHDEIDASECRNILISSENFAIIRKLRKLAEFLGKERRVCIIVFLREQSDWIESVYTQLYRQNRFYPGIHNAIGRPRFKQQLDYESVLGRWEDVFGADNIHVIPYAGGVSRRRTMFSRFLDVLEVKDEGLLEKLVSLKSNEAMPPVCIELMHRLCERGEHFFYSRLDHYCSKYAAEVIGKSPRYKRLSDEERNRIKEDYKTINRNVAKKYLGTDVLFPDDPQGGGARERYPKVAESEIADLQRWLVAKLFDELQDAGREWQKQRDYIQELESRLRQ